MLINWKLESFMSQINFSHTSVNLKSPMQSILGLGCGCRCKCECGCGC